MSSSQNRSFNVSTAIMNNGRTFGTRINQRRQNRQRKRYQRRTRFINNQDMLNRIKNLQRQTTNDPLLDQFFNGSLF